MARTREAVLLLSRMPLSEVNRPALASAARRAALEALLAGSFPLVRICNDISVLASSAFGPGIPEGPARLRGLRAALRSAEGEASLAEDDGTKNWASQGPGLPGCPCARAVPVRGRLPLPASLVVRAKENGAGLRILRFKPSGLRGTPRELSDRLADLSRRGILAGLYAITGGRPDSPVREFALLLPDHPGPGAEGHIDGDPLEAFPVSGRLRTLLASGKDSVPDLSGFEVFGGEAEPPAVRNRIAPAKTWSGRLPGKAGKAKPEKAGFLGRSASVRGARADIPWDGEFRNATILRAELPGFLAALKGLDPRRAAEFLNLVLSRMTRCVEAADGIVDSFAGGAILAFWGAPLATGKEAEAAADSALALRRVVRILSRGRAASGGFPFRMSCSLDSSPVLAGRLGSPDRLSYTVAGEAVSRSAWIGIYNETLGTDILVTEYAMRLMGQPFLFHPIESAGGKGRGRGGRFGIYALMGRKGDPACPRDLKDLRESLGIRPVS